MALLSLSSWAHASSTSGYRLGPSDLIKIHVFGEKELSSEVRLTDAGTFTYPFLGEVEARGLTISDLKDKLTTGLKGDYLISPKITVTILEYRSFFINGEVKKPGGYPFLPGLTVRKAIALAGGFTERAAKRNIKVIHDDKTSSEEKLDLAAEVLPGDIITVDDSFFQEYYEKRTDTQPQARRIEPRIN